MRPSAVRVVVAGALAVQLLLDAPSAQSPSSDRAASSSSPAADLLDRYARADYDGAIRLVNAIDKPEQMFDDLRAIAPRWIHAGGSSDKRRLVVATVALEIVHARQAVPWRLRWPFIVWACELLRHDARHSAAERWWYLTSVAVMEEGGDWLDLVGTPAGAAYLPARRFFSAADQEEFRVGHLSHAKEAFPREPRFLLAEVMAREHASYLGSTTGPPPHGIGAEEIPASLPADLTRRAAGAKVDALADITSDNAKRMLARISSLSKIAADFQTLSRFPEVRGEVELHLGFSDIRGRQWRSALAHLDLVPTLTSEPYLIALSRYFEGWVYQRTSRRDDAITAYRLALDLAPRARSLSALLAAQLAEAGRSAEGYAVMSQSIASSVTSADPWTMFGLGDARLYQEFIGHLRDLIR